MPEQVVMSPEQILAVLERADRKLPVEAIEAAREQREQVVPLLIEVLRTATAEAKEGKEHEGHAPFFALFLLAEFGAKEALPAIVEALALPEKYLEHLFGDAISEAVPRIIAALADDPLELCRRIIDDQSFEWFTRWAMTDVLPYLVRDGRLSREEAVEFLRERLRLAIDRKDKEIVGPIVCALADLWPQEALEDIRRAYSLNLVDDEIISLEDVEESQEGGPELAQKYLASLPPTGIPDTIEELEMWASFASEDKTTRLERAQSEEIELPDESFTFAGAEDYDDWDSWDVYPQPTPTIRNERPRVGRNDPCPCGSGKKFKKCCGRK